MNTSSLRSVAVRIALIITLWISTGAVQTRGTPILKAGNTDALNLTTSWVGGVAPGAGDIATWDSTVAAANSSVLGANASWGGIQIVNPGGAVTIAATAATTLTNGASGIDLSSATFPLTMACASYLGAAQTWNVPDINLAGASLTVSGAIGGPATSTLTKSGTGRVAVSANGSTFTNDLVVNGGTLSATAAASNTGNASGTPTTLGRLLPTRTITVNSNGTLTFTNSNDVFAGGNSTAACPAPQIVVNAGGTLRAGRLLATGGGFGNNFGRLTLNGGSVVLNQGNSATFGPAILTDTVTVGGGAASSVSSAIGDNSFMNLGFRGSTIGVTFDVADATGDASPDLTISVPLKGAANSTVAATTPSLTKTGNGTLLLTAANIYAGKTIVNAGKLALGGSASLASTALEFSAPTTLDVTGLAGSSYTFASGKILALTAASGTVGINATGGSVTFAAGAFATFTASGGGSTVGKISVTGDLVLNNNTVTITVTGSPLGAGTYRLMECSGTLTGSLGASPTIAGTGLVLGGSATIVSTEGAGGTVDLVVTVGTPKNLIWAGNGVANLWDTTSVNWTGESNVFSSLDVATFNDAGNNSPAVDLVGVITPSLIVVSNFTKDYTIGTTTTGSLAGGGGLTKAGTGKLTLTTANTFTGKTAVNGGTLSIDGDAKLGTFPATFVADQLGINGGVLQVTASGSFATNRGVLHGVAGGNYDVSTGANAVIPAVISGTGGLTKSGPGTLTLGGLNSYAGDVTINGGILSGTAGGGPANGTYLGINSPFGVVTNTRTITVNNAATLSLDAPNIFAGGQTTGITPAPKIVVNQGCTLRTVVSDGNNFGKVTLNGATFLLGNGHGSVYGAAILTDTITVGGSTASLIISNGTVNSTMNLGYRTSTNGIVFDVANVTGDANADLVINATLRNAANTAVPATDVSLVKTGAGTLQLDGLNAYTGQTVVSNGTLSGIGTIAGPVVVSATGNLAPGGSLGTMTINGALTLNGSVTVEVNTNASPNCDQITGPASIAYGGALLVQNLGSGVEIGDAFQLFPAASFTGDFASITPSPGAGKAWSFDPATGLLSVVSTAGAPPTLSVSQAGNVLTFSWSGSFKLQSQTNSLSQGLSPNPGDWFDYPTPGNPVNVTINPANPTVFFRLKNL